MGDQPENYDAVVVGARCAGAATAMLLARSGLEVLLLDRDRPGRDTLSTHALMRAGVLQLDRWGVLDRIVEAGTPAISATTFHYGDVAETVEMRRPLYAARRTVLDSALVAAAAEAGATVRFGVSVTDLCRDRWDRVTGVVARTRAGETVRLRAPIVVGADGIRSTVARLVDAPVLHRGTAASAIVYGYWPSPPSSRYRWFYRPGCSAGIIPTNDGQVCVWAGLPAARFAATRTDGLEAVFGRVFADAAPVAVDLVDPDARIGPLRGFPGLPSLLRAAAGPGWALVGDAGYFKDPLTAHGITDALRDAEFLARAIVDGRPHGFAAYQDTRDRLAGPLIEVAEVIAAYRWDLTEIRDLLLAESRAMKPEVDALLALDEPALAKAA